MRRAAKFLTTFTWRIWIAGGVALAMLLGHAAPAQAVCPGQECSGRCCDVVAGAGPTSFSHSLVDCDQLGTPADPNTPDGFCVICTSASGGTVINGASINETICGGAGDDELDGKGGNDVLLGLEGDDELTGAGGVDVINGGPGADLIEGGNGGDLLLAGEGPGDQIFGGSGDDIILGSAEDDMLYGEAGDDTIINLNGADWVEGGSGDDTLLGTNNTNVEFDTQFIGSTYCGGPGDDVIDAFGGAHHCMDGGESSNDADECSFTYGVDDPITSFDVGTAIFCETETGTDTRDIECGCD